MVVTGLPSGVQSIAAGGGHTCALTAAGGVVCWGWNKYGQLGDGSTTDQTSPVPVVGLSSGVRAIAAGYGHTCALNADGHVSCWGANPRGQLGDGTTQNNSSPATVAGLTAVAQALSAGGAHTCAVLSGGDVSCWGNNADGQLGDGTNAKRTGPIAVTGLTSVQSVAAGAAHTCAVTGTGAVLCWGSNEYGQVGDGTQARIRAYPVAVLSPRTGTPPAWVERTSVFSDPAAANYWWIGCDATGCGKVKGTTYVIETKKPVAMMYWATEPGENLRTATLTLDVASMSGSATSYLGLACMITGRGTSSYEIAVTSDGWLFFFKNAKGKFSSLQDPIKLSGFNKKKPPRLIFGCESRPEGVLLSALFVDVRLYTALDKKPLKTGSAALGVGNFTKGTSAVAFREIDVVGELKP